MRTSLFRDNRALALVEFAMSLPLLLILLLGGVELTNQILVQKQLSQIAMMVADNASRMGDDAVLGAKPVNEREINDLLLGAEIEAGGLDIAKNGRIILSSIERNEDGGQWVHWQRCFGLKPDFQPAYEEGEGSSGTDFEGLGTGPTALLASEGDAIMFVELAYDYAPIVPIHFAVGGVKEFRSSAAMNVRDRRDLSGVQSYPGATPSTC